MNKVIVISVFITQCCICSAEKILRKQGNPWIELGIFEILILIIKIKRSPAVQIKQMGNF